MDVQASSDGALAENPRNPVSMREHNWFPLVCGDIWVCTDCGTKATSFYEPKSGDWPEKNGGDGQDHVICTDGSRPNGEDQLEWEIHNALADCIMEKVRQVMES